MALKTTLLIFLLFCTGYTSTDSIFVNKSHFFALDDICEKRSITYKLNLYTESFTFKLKDSIYLTEGSTYFKIGDSTIIIKRPPIIYKGKFFVSKEILNIIFH